MSELFRAFADRQVSRRDFASGLAALGFSATAVSAATRGLAAPDAAAAVSVRGTGAEIVVDTLRAANVRHIFATTATGMSALFDAMTMRGAPQLILALAESQATSMAHGYELATGETSVLLVPGVAIPSTMNNLYNAWKDRSSILVLADSPSLRVEGRNGFQQMEDWLGPMAAFTKWRWEMRNETQISEMIRRAFKVAGTPPGGPVHVRISLDLLGARDVSQVIHPQQRFRVPLELPPAPALVEQAARLLLEARQPLICAGGEVTRAGAGDALIELAELLGIPVAQGYSVYSDFPFRHPLFAGFYGLGVPRDLARTDVFLNLGSPMPDPTLFTAPPPRTAKVIDARIEFGDIANTYPTDVPIAAGIRETLVGLTDAIRGLATSARLEAIAGERLALAREQQAREDALRTEAARASWNSSPMSWERVSHELHEQLEPDAIIVPELDYRTPFEWLNIARGGRRLIGQTTGFALGWGIGAALGVKVARPDEQVVALVGDGALLFGQAEALWTAARHEIPALIVVLNNRSYDNERNRIQNNSPLYTNRDTREKWRDLTCFLGSPVVDFAGLAKSLGVPAGTAATPAEFRAQLRRARDVCREGRPYLVDAIIMQLDRRGAPTSETWFPRVSIAGSRRRRV